jgi:hypothetical protein
VTGSASADFSAFCDGSAPATSSQLPQAWSDLVQSLRAAKPNLGFVVVQRAGSWYVSPTRSMLDDLEAVLHAVPSDLLTKLAGVFNASSIIGSASSRLSTSLPPGLHCVNGVATMTVPSVPGRPSLPPLTIPCPPGQ